MRPEASTEGMWNMHDFMNQYFGLFLFAEPIKPFGEDLDDIMRVLVQGELHNPWKSVTPGNHPSARRTFTPQAGQPGFIDMGHLEFPEDLPYSGIDIFGKEIFNHRSMRLAPLSSRV
jgi:hypothetical protein